LVQAGTNLLRAWSESTTRKYAKSNKPDKAHMVGIVILHLHYRAPKLLLLLLQLLLPLLLLFILPSFPTVFWKYGWWYSTKVPLKTYGGL